MVKASSELLAVSRRWFKNQLDNSKGTLTNLLSANDDLRLLGTAADENWSGQEVRVAVADYFQVIPEILHHEECFAEAFEDGNIGWSLFIHKVTFAASSDTPVEYRDTLIFSLEEGSWKIIHRHGSVPTPNQESMGVVQTGITQLAEAARQNPSLGQTQGLASVMFTDVVDSSILASALGDRAWSAKINTHFGTITTIVKSHGGQFVKSLGDGTMSSFSSARSAMAAAIEIQRALVEDTTEPCLAVRIGVHTGDVVQTPEDFFGSVVNVAARITAASGSSEILVSDVTRALVGNDPNLTFELRGSHELRGQQAPNVLHSLEWRA